MGVTLLCSDVMAERHGGDWQTIAPGLTIVQLPTGPGAGEVSADDIATIDIAFFSGDVFPDRSANFMKVALQASNLRWLHVFNAGTDHPVFGMFRERGVRLTTSSGASARPIAHTVLMQLLAMTRGARTWFAEQERREWRQRDVLDMEGRTVAVVGLGAIGSEVARLCAAFGMHVIGVRRTPVGNEPCETWPTSRLHELLAIADDVVLAVPSTPDTVGLIGAEQLRMMRPGAHLVNVGRGDLIDEPALIDALDRGHVGAAALDVFATEPLPADSPLWAMPNVIVTPHSSGATSLARHRAVGYFTDNLCRWVAGSELLNEVT